MNNPEIHHIEAYLMPKTLEQFLNFCKKSDLIKPEYDFYDENAKARCVRMHFKPMLKEGVLFGIMSPTDPKSRIHQQIDKDGEGINHLAIRVHRIQDVINNIKKINPQIVIAPHDNRIIDTPMIGIEGATHVHLDPKFTGQVHIQLIEFGCPKCGAQMFRMNQKYCHECGTKISLIIPKVEGDKKPNYYKK